NTRHRARRDSAHPTTDRTAVGLASSYPDVAASAQPSRQHSRFTRLVVVDSMAAVPRESNDLSFDHSILISAAPTRVLAAFFDPAALAIWWQTVRSVPTARPLGIYAVEWEPTMEVDDLLGRLGGVFYGNVMEYQPGRELVIADAWWLPPDSGPIGPMSLQVQCS